MRLATADEARQRIGQIGAVPGEDEAAGGIDSTRSGRAPADGDPSGLLERERGVEQLDHLASPRRDDDRLDVRPAVDPLDAGEERLATERRERAREAAGRTPRATSAVPAVGRLDQVGVTDVLHGTRRARGRSGSGLPAKPSNGPSGDVPRAIATV